MRALLLLLCFAAGCDVARATPAPADAGVRDAAATDAAPARTYLGLGAVCRKNPGPVLGTCKPGTVCCQPGGVQGQPSTCMTKARCDAARLAP